MFNFLLLLILLPVLVIGVFIFILARKRKSKRDSEKEWYLEIFFSKEDAVSQAFFVLAVLGVGVSLLAVNKELGDPLSIQTLIFLTGWFAVACAYRFRVLLLLPLGIFGLTGWWAAKAMEWVSDNSMKTAAVFTGFAFIAVILYLLGRLHEKKYEMKRFAFTFNILGMLGITGLLFFFSMRSGLDTLADITRGMSFVESWQLSLSLLIFLSAVIGLLFFTFTNKQLLPGELFGLIATLAFFLVLMFLPEQEVYADSVRRYYYSSSMNLTSAGIAWALLFNVLIFINVLGIIFVGYIRQEKRIINMGAYFLFVLIIAKYFDWFFSFFDKSIFFISAGILMFLVGWLMEKGRKRMLKNVASSKPLITGYGNK